MPTVASVGVDVVVGTVRRQVFYAASGVMADVHLGDLIEPLFPSDFFSFIQRSRFNSFPVFVCDMRAYGCFCNVKLSSGIVPFFDQVTKRGQRAARGAALLCAGLAARSGVARIACRRPVAIHE
ncbi:MAG: hypothetical protein LBP52_03285 [Burkholderiaceae bacterium]|nr:hypothetical protein [Burkholderiaceae bacterium]